MLIIYKRDYLEANVPYMRIRMFCALNGIMLVPISYWTIRGCGLTTATAILTAMMICYGKIPYYY